MPFFQIPMFNPVVTYRVQFHKGFTFAHLQSIIPYLHQLGVRTIYASPIFEAVRGSTHGYDGVHPHRINPEIGTLDELKNISRQLKEKGITWLQDIVPNHMAFHPANTLLMDVLEKGAQSTYASFFDIGLGDATLNGRLMVPFLGSTVEEAISNKELKILYNEGHFHFAYYESFFPLSPRSYVTILHNETEAPQGVQQFLIQLNTLHSVEDATAYTAGWKEITLQLNALMNNSITAGYINTCIQKVNNNPELLQQIEGEQHYRLCHWQETDNRINYRRFFTVNGLICLNMQHEAVFDYYHQQIAACVKEDDLFQGLRIDHIDGLYHPQQYLQQLRNTAGSNMYIVVEKILAEDEDLLAQWPVQGTTGYEFLAQVNNVLTNTRAKEAFTQFYYSLLPNQGTVVQQVRDKKAYMLYTHIAGELDNLYHLFAESDLVPAEVLENIPAQLFKKAIGQFLVHCTVYRYYAATWPLSGKEKSAVQNICNRIQQTEEDIAVAVHVLQHIFLQDAFSDEEYSNRALHFYRRCMQFSGPLMAKGVEDTLMYTFNRFIGHNEVGDAPEAFGITIQSFHLKMQQRQVSWPMAINATATHDTKRGEDFRARLNVLTDMPAEWLAAVTEWQQLNAALKTGGVPDNNDEYFIYQTLIGSYPFGSDEEGYAERLTEYLQKALREAKEHSNWTTPDEVYEAATKNFALALLKRDTPFFSSFQKLLTKVVPHGIHNSLVQVMLKFTCPGVPDVYQGCELWDFSFVDPDNRRPVDYKERERLLNELTNSKGEVNFFKTPWPYKNGSTIKLWLVHHLLKLRQREPELFTIGDYIPLSVTGKYKDHILSFARKLGTKWYLIALPLGVASICKQQKKELHLLDWQDTAISLPDGVYDDWENVVSNTKEKANKKFLAKDLFKHTPFAILKMQSAPSKRHAGVLLHLSSLPSPFGIGDLGPEAYHFILSLARSRQRYWQMLPINPTEEGQSHSPYSSISSRAGNTLFISPQLLVKDGWLKTESLYQHYLSATDAVDYRGATKAKEILFNQSWLTFKHKANGDQHNAFAAFCNKENSWLHDFALYVIIKKEEEGKPWYQWPNVYKNRDAAALQEIAEKYKDDIQKEKWLQHLFAQQWAALKAYGDRCGVQLIGDLPFYVSHDSADVWAFQKLFYLNEMGEAEGIAGVPPDAFSADGQLWGMPVFKWDVLEQTGYKWWIERLQKNRELFHLVRLDHFRAFAAYWMVPAGELTAKNGSWQPGPGAPFFEALKKEFGALPFLAEDLGEIDEPVYQLRDGFNMPGMKILQFAFGGNAAASDYMPHNYTPHFFVYTGTHDNNTTCGWYRTETTEEVRQQLSQYAGAEVTEHNVHLHLCRMAHASVAHTVILPAQDVLGLDEQARMNKPASITNNWQWRLLPGQWDNEVLKKLCGWTTLYNRT